MKQSIIIILGVMFISALFLTGCAKEVVLEEDFNDTNISEPVEEVLVIEELEDAIPGKPCWECGRLFKKGEKWHYYYHADQDDRVCTACAKKLKHTDTAYAGMPVWKTNQ